MSETTPETAEKPAAAPPTNPNLAQLGQVQTLVTASQSALSEAATALVTAVENVLSGEITTETPVLVGDALAAGEAILESLAPPFVKPIIAGLIGAASPSISGLQTQADAKIVGVLQLFVARLKALNL